ncbi:MAG: prenyltransferase/squalene oxidase repeat-containing protein [Candidatus Bathyarchaeia archaeon]|jgi:prenyltransferase beta subunit
MRYAVYLAVAAFLVSLLVSTIIVQASTQILTETRRSAIITSLPQESFDALGTAQMLLTLEALGGLKSVDLEQKLNQIISDETVTTASGTLWNWPVAVSFENVSYINELYTPYLITTVLRQFGAENRVNRTALLNLVMERYNQTDGAFHEQSFEVQESPTETMSHAFCTFPLEQETYYNGGYAQSNMISTFLAVSILANLDALDSINVTKTINWILACKAENGAFRPSPEGDFFYYNYRGWYVDEQNRTGIAFTYAALSTLRTLGVSAEETVDAERLRAYVMSCEKTSDGGVEFAPCPPVYGYDFGEDFPSTYYAIMLLRQIGGVENEPATVSGVVAYIKSQQNNALQFKDSWPIPQRGSAYGLFPSFAEPYDPRILEYFASSILNITDNLHVLDETTPIASRTLGNLLEFSALVSVSTFGLSVTGMLTYSSIHECKEKKKSRPPPPS